MSMSLCEDYADVVVGKFERSWTRIPLEIAIVLCAFVLGEQVVMLHLLECMVVIGLCANSVGM